MLLGILLTLALELELELKLAALLPCFLVLCGTHITYLYVSMRIMERVGQRQRVRVRGRERGREKEVEGEAGCSHCMAACVWI